MEMTLDKAIRTINRFYELKIYEMEQLNEVFPPDGEEKLIETIKWLYSDQERMDRIKWVIEADEDSFRTFKGLAKLWIKAKDFRSGCKTFKHLKLF